MNPKHVLAGLLIGMPLGAELQLAVISSAYRVIGFGLPADGLGWGLLGLGLASGAIGLGLLATTKKSLSV